VESIDEVLKESFIDVVVPQDTSIERIVQAERERSAAKEQSE
jgi:ASC-1-like (ASCH) protein